MARNESPYLFSEHIGAVVGGCEHTVTAYRTTTGLIALFDLAAAYTFIIGHC